MLDEWLAALVERVRNAVSRADPLWGIHAPLCAFLGAARRMEELARERRHLLVPILCEVLAANEDFSDSEDDVETGACPSRDDEWVHL